MTAPAGGERALVRLLAGLQPALDPVGYRFLSLDEAYGAPRLREAVAVVREQEGVTLVVGDPGLSERADDSVGAWARIVLTVHSDLEAVGLLAAVAERLAARGIPVNAMAGWFHDHLFVPWGRRRAALAALVELQREAAAGAGDE